MPLRPQVYNETLVDLLKAPEAGEKPPSLAVVDGPDGTVEVKGLRNEPCASADEALQLLYDAEINRQVASHALNVASSRSHLVVTAKITAADAEGSSNAKLVLVDLAGAERLAETASRDGTATVREAGYINRSLAFLEQVDLSGAGRPKSRLLERPSLPGRAFRGRPTEDRETR